MCDTMVSLTDDGVLFAKNSDRDANEAQLLEFYPAATHEPGRVQVTHTAIDQAGQTYAVVLSRPWWMWGAEMGANEHGVVLGNEAVFTRRTGNPDGELLGMDLLRLALERAGNRHEAVEVIVQLLERHGQGGACSYERPKFTYDNSYLIADPAGAIVLETAGKHWATEEVTGAGRSISNGLTIPGFADRYADPARGMVAACSQRRARTEPAAQAATGVLDLFAALRDHGESRGPHPRYRVSNGALDAPCAHAGGVATATQSTSSWVADLTAGVHWVTGTSAPCTSIFKPIGVGELPAPPPSGARNAYDGAQPWWRHERLHRRWTRNPTAFESAAAARDALEAEWTSALPEFSDAWESADAWERDALTIAPGDDERPLLVRELWRGYDSAAGMEYS